MINWTWQDTFDVMTTILVTDYCCTTLYIAIPQAHINCNLLKSVLITFVGESCPEQCRPTAHYINENILRNQLKFDVCTEKCAHKTSK